MPAQAYSGDVPPIRRRRYLRAERLRALGFDSYDAYLKSPAWRTVKARYRASDLPQACQLCEDEDVDLHHTTYERVGAEPLEDLVPLCRRCHAMVHVLEQRGEVALDFTGFEDPERAAVGRAYLDDLVASRAAEANERRAELDALPIAERIARAQRAAEVSGINLSYARARLHRHIRRGLAGRPDKIAASLRAFEDKAYGWHKPKPGNEVMPDHPEPKA